jgi:hypothetical protein
MKRNIQLLTYMETIIKYHLQNVGYFIETRLFAERPGSISGWGNDFFFIPLLPTGFGEQLASWAVKTFGKPAGE